MQDLTLATLASLERQTARFATSETFPKVKMRILKSTATLFVRLIAAVSSSAVFTLTTLTTAHAASTAPQQLEVAQQRMTERLMSLIAYLPMIGVAAVVLLLFWLLSRWVGSWSWPFNKLSRNGFVQDLFRQLARLVVMLLGVLVALDLLNATALLGAVLGTAGVLGLAVGFAFKDVVENYLAGVLLSLRQPFQPRDHIEVEGFSGKVMRLTSRATIMMTLDGNHVRIPNAVVFKSPLTNFTRNPLRRFDFVVGVGSGENLAAAQQIGVLVLADMKSTLSDPAPSATLEPPGDSSIGVHFYGWVDQAANSYTKVLSEAIRLVTATLADAGIDMPEPIYRLHWLNGAQAGKQLTISVDDEDTGAADDAPAEGPAKSVTAKISPTVSRKSPTEHERNEPEMANSGNITGNIVAEQDTSVEHDVDEQIDREEAGRASKDLLSARAPQE